MHVLAGVFFGMKTSDRIFLVATRGMTGVVAFGGHDLEFAVGERTVDRTERFDSLQEDLDRIILRAKIDCWLML